MIKELNQYYREVRRHLFCSKKEKDLLILQANQMVEELQESNPDLNTFDDIIAFLGSPQELAQTFMERMDPIAIKHYRGKKKRLHISIAILIASVIVALSIFSAYVLQMKSHVNITREDTLIIDENGRAESKFPVDIYIIPQKEIPK